MATALSRSVSTCFPLLKSNRYEEISKNIDHRSNGYKTRKEILQAKTDAVIFLIRRALDTGIKAGYVLMSKWFTTESMIKSVLAEMLDVIDMVKQSRAYVRALGKP